MRKPWLPLYKTLKKAALKILNSFEEVENQKAIVWKHHSAFAEIKTKKSGLTLSFPLNSLHLEWEPTQTLQISKNRISHTFELTTPEQIIKILPGLQAAYDLTINQKPLGRAPKTNYTNVDEYIGAFDPQIREILDKIRSIILSALPMATEKISWQMPTYFFKENLIHFAAAKNHVSIFPTPEAIAFFNERLKQYSTRKGTVQFPYAKEIPYQLIGEIALWRYHEVASK